MHAEGTSRALREDSFDDLALLRSQLIFLIKSSYLLNKLTNIAKHDFNSMPHKLMSFEEISYTYIYIIIRYCVCLFVRYRNYLPVVQFQNQAHIRNPHGPAEVFKTI